MFRRSFFGDRRLFGALTLISGLLFVFLPHTTFAINDVAGSFRAPDAPAATELGVAPPRDPVPAPAPTPAPAAASAAANSSLVQLSIPIGGKNSVSGLPEYIVTWYQYALGIVTIVGVIMLIVGGFKYLLSASIPEVTDGKQIIQNVIGGTVILFLAYVILYNINPKTVNLSLPEIRQVRQLPGCVQNSDCGTGMICFLSASGGTCMQDQLRTGTAVGSTTCNAVTDCPAGSRCVSNHCALAPTNILCTTNADCGNGQACSPSSVCCATDACITITATCDTRAACATGTTCFLNKRVCRNTVIACVNDQSCPARQRCVAHVCQISGIQTSSLSETPTTPAPTPAPTPGTPATPPPVAAHSVAQFGACEADIQCVEGLRCAALVAGGARSCLTPVP